jgi:hypothetical protein
MTKTKKEEIEKLKKELEEAYNLLAQSQGRIAEM